MSMWRVFFFRNFTVVKNYKQRPLSERESGSYSGTRQRNRFNNRSLVSKRVFDGVTQSGLKTPPRGPGRVFFSA